MASHSFDRSLARNREAAGDTLYIKKGRRFIPHCHIQSEHGINFMQLLQVRRRCRRRHSCCGGSGAALPPETAP